MPNNSSQTNKSLDEILAELEQRFGSDSSSSASTPSHSPHKKNKTMSPNTIVGALVFTLLVVGVASAMWLGSRGQDIRQQAEIAPYACSEGGGTCRGSCAVNEVHLPGRDSSCEPDVIGGGQVCCAPRDTNPPLPTSTPLEICPNGPSEGSYCAPGTSQGDCNLELEYTTHDATCASTVRCCPIGGGGNPTNTPIPVATPTTPPAPTNTPGGGGDDDPTPTPVAGQCVSITMTNLDGSTQPPGQNDSVTFTCGSVAGAARYEFRVRAPGVTEWANLNPSSTGARVSVPFTFTLNGSYRAQCRPCTGTSQNTCQAWEQ